MTSNFNLRFYPPLFNYFGCFLLLFGMFYSNTSQGQNGVTYDLHKIDPALYFLLPLESEDVPVSFANPWLDSSTKIIEGEKYIHCKIFGIELHAVSDAFQLQMGSDLPTFFTSWIRAEQCLLLSLDSRVAYIEAPIQLFPNNDHARARTGAALLHNGGLASTVYKGDDVIVAIIDAGFDWQHADFIDPSNATSTRVLHLWDQEITAISGESTPNGNDVTLTCCNFGVEYTKADIDAELTSSTGSIRNADASNHGTHVAGTAAGDGSSLSPAQHIGMAPLADVIFVNTNFSDAGIIDALTFLTKKAADASKPIAVNLSLGSDFGPHDGTSALARAIDVFCGTGQIVACAAGNENGDDLHVSGTITEGNTSSFTVTIPSYTANSGTQNDLFQLDIWIQNNDSVTATVLGPNGSSTTTGVNSSTGVITASDGAVQIINSENVNNGDRNISITVFDFVDTNPPAAGLYTITLTNIDQNHPYDKTLTYHAWNYSRSNDDFALTAGDNTYIIGSPASAKECLAVGAFAHKWRWQNSLGSSITYGGTERSDDLSSFSSIGPLRDGTTKPDITAPGQGMISSLSTFSTAGSSRIVAGGLHYVTQGTSMACPVVTGACALLLGKDNSLTAAQIKTLLTDNAQTDSYTGSVPNNSWGYGKLDILRSMAKAINGSASPVRTQYTYDDWGSTSNLPITGANPVAVRFSTTSAGNLSSVFFHTGSTSISLSGDIQVSIHSDNSGDPGTQIGTTFTVDDATVAGHRWHQALCDNTITLAASTDYHAVFTLANTNDDMSYNLDVGSVDNRSAVGSGSSWLPQSGFDFRIRPVVTDGGGVGVLPVELLGFEARWTSDQMDKAKLSWQTATELNNSHFDIERSYDGVNWFPIGVEQGNGTKLTLSSYQYIDYDLMSVKSGSTVFYRLKQLDFDGKFEYSPVTALTSFTSSKESLLVLQYQDDPRKIKLTKSGNYNLYSSDGRSIMSLSNGLDFDLADIPSGVYFIRSESGENAKIVIP